MRHMSNPISIINLVKNNKSMSLIILTNSSMPLMKTNNHLSVKLVE